MSRFTRGLTHSTTIGGTGLNIDQADEGSLLIGTGVGFDLSTLTAGSGVVITNGPGTILISATGSGGSVTSVGLTTPAEFTVSNSPITGAGNIGLTWANESGNVVLASPSGGGSGAPGFRVLVAADIPNLDTAKITTGTLALARLSGITTTQLSNTAGITSGQISSVAASTITGIISSSNLSLVASDIPSLDVAKITTGIFATSFIPNLDTSKITSGTLSLARLSGITTTELSATAGIIAAQIASVNPSVLTGSGTVPLTGLSGITTSQLSATAGIVAGQITSVNPSALTGSGTVPSAGLPIASASVLGAIKVGSGLSIASGVLSATSSGTVTSVDLTAPSEITVGGSPITGSGTIALTWTNETGNVVFASPSGGGSGTPGFRTLVAADVPNLSAAKITSGILTVARGGTGLDTSGATNGQLLIGTGTGLALSTLTAGSNITITNTSGAISIASTGGGGASPLTTKGDVYGHSTVDARVGVGADGTFLAADSSQATGLAYKFPAGIAGVSTLSNYLSADVPMTTAGTFYDGPSLALSAGTWLLIGNVALTNGSFATDFLAKLWDGTTTLSSNVPSGRNVATASVHVPLQAIVSPTTTTTYKISVKSDNNSSTIQATSAMTGETAVANTSSYLVAVQLTGAPASGPGALMPAVRARNSSNQSISSGGFDLLTFDTTDLDQGTSTAQHSVSSNTSRLTCRQAGTYLITGAIAFAASSAGNYRQLRVLLNGTTEIGINSGPLSATIAPRIDVVTLYYLNVGDYVELEAGQDSGGSLNSLVDSVKTPSFGMARIDSGPGAVQPNTKVQLDYAANTDIANGVALTANTWTTIGSAQTFTIDDPNSVVDISTGGLIFIGDGFQAQAAGTSCEVASRLIIDGSTTKQLGGDFFVNDAIQNSTSLTGNGRYLNPLSGSDLVSLTGLTAGSHTVAVQVQCNVGSQNAYCRASTKSGFESLQIRVFERKQSSSPPSSTPAPAVRCYNSGGSGQSISSTTLTTITLDTNDYDQGTSTPQHSTSTNTSRLVCQQAGIYTIHGQIRYPANGTGVFREARILLNGATQIAQDSLLPSTTSPSWVEVNTAYYLNVGDYVELQGYQDSGSPLVLDQTAHFTPAFMMARIDSGPGAVQPNTKVQLDYIANTDLASGAGLSATTWTDVGSNQTFIVDDINSVIEVEVSGFIKVNSSSGANDVSSRLAIDSGGTPQYFSLGGMVTPGINAYVNVLTGAGTVSITGLSAGSHTAKIQVYGTNAGLIYCRASTQSNIETLEIRVLERKQSSSPPSSTPAPAVRAYNNAAISIITGTSTALTFNTNRVDQGTSTPQHSVLSNTSRLTCQQAGLYQITGNVDFAGASGGTNRVAWIQLNGSTIIGIQSTNQQGASTDVRLCPTTLYSLGVGDYVELVVFQDSGGNVNVVSSANYSPEFMMARMDTGSVGILLTTTQTANYSIPSVNTLTIVGAASKTMTLPTAAGVAGQSCVVTNNASGTSTTIATTSSQTIKGASTYSLASAWASATFTSDGSNWLLTSAA